VSGEDGPGGRPVGDELLLAELNEEVRRRRTAGDLLPSFEQHLDDAFAAVTPGRDRGSFKALLQLAERYSHLDIEAPVRSKLPGGELAKGTLRKMTWWYFDYVAQQLNRFGSAATRLLQILDERVSKLEGADVAAGHAAALAPPFDHEPWIDLVGATMVNAPGRVLHAGCADGRLLAALVARDIAAYGVDTRADLLDHAAAAGLDVLVEEPLRHLESLEDGALGGAVLSGFVDLLVLPAHFRAVELASRKVAPGGVLVVLGTSPDVWTRAVPEVVADLSPGRPLHAETWKHLLVVAGFEHLAVNIGQSPERSGFAVVGERGQAQRQPQRDT
jgi:SAM-dependent methyltransferase